MEKKTMTYVKKMKNNKCRIMEATSTEQLPKIDNLVMRCAECSENYSEDRAPRILACGHSVCTPCAEKCLAGQKLCPECQEKQLANNITDLPINFPLLRLIRSIATEGIDISDMISPTFPVDISCSDRPKDVWNCGAHGNPMLFLCCSCSIWVCQDCLVVDHPLLPRGSCRILGLADALIQVKNEHKRVANQALKGIENIKRTFESKMAMHNFCLKHCPKNTRSHSCCIQQIENQLKELRLNNELVVRKAEERVSKSVDLASSTTSPEEMTMSCKELIDCQRVLEEDIAKEEESFIPVQRIMQEHLRSDLRMFVGGKEPVYAVLDGNEGSKWSHIRIQENQLLLYCLNDGKPPEGGIAVPFEHVRKLIPDETMTIFIEVGTEEEVVGRVYVRLDVDTGPMTQQFILMCSGEKGSSYRNTRFYEYDGQRGLLKGGDYEYNDGRGGRAIVKDLEDSYANGSYDKSAGALVADRTSTRFHFHLNDFDHYVDDIIGSVTRGLAILKSSVKVEPVKMIRGIQVEPVTKSMIRDCGLLIPMKSEKPSE